MPILISLEQCPGCEKVKNAYPDLPFVEIPRDCTNCSEETLEIKEVIKLLGITSFPTILSDDLTAIIPISELSNYLKK